MIGAVSVAMFVLGKPRDLDKSLSLCVYSWIEFCNLVGAVEMNSKTPLILEGFEDDCYKKQGMSPFVKIKPSPNYSLSLCLALSLNSTQLKLTLTQTHLSLLQRKLTSSQLLSHTISWHPFLLLVSRWALRSHSRSKDDKKNLVERNPRKG